jgi:hypothetical protein
MDNGALSLISGLVEGFGQSQQQKRQREQEKEARAIQKEMMRLKLEDAKRESAKQSMQQKILDAILAGQGGAPTPMGPSFNEDQVTGLPTTEQAPSVVDDVVNTQMGGGLWENPGFLASSKMAGFDLTPIASLLERQGHNSALERQGNERIGISKEGLGVRKQAEERAQNEYRRGFTEGHYVDRMLPDGTTEQVWMPKYAGDRPSIPKTIRASEKPIPPKDLPNYRNNEGAIPQTGTTPKEAMEQGFKPVGPTQTSQAISASGALDILGEIRNAMNGVFPKSEPWWMRMVSGPQRWMSGATQTNPDAAKFMKLSKGALGTMIRALGEKGALSDGDVSRAVALLPKLTDKADVAWNAMATIEKILAKGKQRNLGEGVPTPTTVEEFNALPSGTVYTDPDDGKQYRKP